MTWLRRLLARQRPGAAWAAAVLAAVAFGAAAMLVPSAAAQASISRSSAGPERALAPMAVARAPVVSEVMHVKETQSYLAGLTSPITPPLVYYIGDSTTRESVVSEARWAAKVLQLGGPDVQPYVLTTSNQTFPLDRVIAGGLPSEPALVLIAVGLSRFTNPPASNPTLGEPLGPIVALSPWKQHLYKASDMLSAAQKRVKVRQWLTRRYPLFKKNRAANLAKLAALVQACKNRGWSVALVEMPVNKVIVRHAFDAPIARYRADCSRLAHDTGIRFLQFTSVVSHSSRNFYDIFHLVGDGRTLWQAKLAEKVAALLDP